MVCFVSFDIVTNSVGQTTLRQALARLRSLGGERGFVSHQEGEKLAKEIGAYRYCEISALTQFGLKETLDSCFEAALSPVPTLKPKKKKFFGLF
jgi:hypothetical protein